LDESITSNSELRHRMADAKRKYEASMETKKEEVMTGLKDIGNKLLGFVGMTVDNFKLQQNENGSYNITYQK